MTKIRCFITTPLPLLLLLITVGLLTVPSAHATTSAVQADGGVVWCNGYVSSLTPAYSLTYSNGNGGTVTLPASVQAPDGPNPNDIPDAWENNKLLWPNNPTASGPGETAETVSQNGDAADRYVMQLDYWNSAGSGFAVQQWNYDGTALASGKTVAGAVGYSTGDSCELFYTSGSSTANAGQFTITYPAAPSQPDTTPNANGLTEAQWVAANPTAFPYNGFVPYSGGNITGGGPTGYVSIYKGCGWDANSCTAGSATLTPTNNNPLPLPSTDWNVFPQRLSTVTSIPTTWAITNDPRNYGSPFTKTTPPQHIWDASYDIWFDTTGITGASTVSGQNWGKGPNQYAQARGQNDGLEIMVWMNSNGSYVDGGGPGATGYAAPSGWLRGQVQINNVVYDVWTSRLNNPYYGAYSPTSLPTGTVTPTPVATATYSNETLVPGGADPDTCTNLAANGGPQYGTCGTEWNVVSFVATIYNGTDYRANSMSMDTKVFTDYILGIADGGLWQNIGTPAFRTADNTLACPTHAAQVQYNTGLTSSDSSDCLSSNWWLTSIDTGFEPWLGGNGLESASFQAHVETYPSAVQSGVTTQNGNAVVNWSQPFNVNFPGCPVSGGGYTQVTSGTIPTMTINGYQGVYPHYPYSGPVAGITTLQPAIPITWLGPNGPVNGYPNVVSGWQTGGGQQQLTWNASEGMYVAVINSTYPLNSDVGGRYAVINITADCNGTIQTFPFDVFIDPSGRVLYSDGKTPVVGATVTLLDSPTDSANGPFEAVPNNNFGLTSDVMSPNDNTLNPMPSTQYGTYAWDVAPGYYEVNANLAGCGSVTSPMQHVVNIPITNLNLILPCAPPKPVVVDAPSVPSAPESLTATTVSSSQINLTWNAVPQPVNATSVTYTIEEVSPTPTVIVGGLVGTSYIVTGLNPNTAYSFAVVAVDAGGSSPESTTASVTTQQAPAGKCHVTYNVQSATPGVNNGLTVSFNIQNTGTTALYPWTLSWIFPGNQQISYAWNATETQSGANASLTSSAPWESIPAGGTLYSAVGFNGIYTGTNATPSAFYINGALCQ